MKTLRNSLILATLLSLLLTSASQAQLRLKRGKNLRDRQSTSQKQRSSSRVSESKAANTKDAKANRRDLAKYDFVVTALKGGDNALMTTVKNQGFLSTPESVLSIVVKDRVTGQIRITKTARVAPIESGKVARVRVYPLAIGNSTVQVTVDPANQVPESNEQNNSRFATFAAPTVPTDPNQRADLIVSGLQANGNVLLIQVTNAGRARSGSVPINVVVRGNDGRLRATRTARLGALDVGAIGRVNLRNLVLDDVKVTATVDPDNLVPERNERNNTRQITVANQTEYAPDLKITDIMFKRDQKEVWFSVRNVGPVAQNQDVSLTVKSYFGPGNLVERSALRISRLNTGQSTWHRWNVKQLNSGMQFEGILDISNRLPEQNENNNRRVETFN